MLNLETVLRRMLIGGIFLILITPLIVSNNMFFPYITGKNFFFRFVVEIMMAGWLILAYLNVNYRPKWSPIVIAATVFVAIIALADAMGEYPYKSFWSNYERMEGLVGLLHVFGYFIITTTILNAEKLWKRFFQFSLAVSILMGLYGLGQISGAFDAGNTSTRIDGRFGNATYLAVYALFHIFISAFLFVKESNRQVVMRSLYVFAGILNLFMLYATATRGAMIGLFGGVGLMALIFAVFGKENKKLRMGAIATIAAIVIFIGGFIAIKDAQFIKNSPVLSRFAEISLKETTTRSRFMVWGMAIEGFKERPLLGWGQENFNYVFNKYYDPRMHDQEPWFDRAHNVFFDWLASGGILGLLAYLALFVLGLLCLWRCARLSFTEKTILTGLLAAYFIQNLFVFDNLVSYIMFFSVLGYIAVISRNEETYLKTKTNTSLRPLDAIVMSAIVVGMVSAVYFVTYKPFVTNITLLDAIRPHEEGVQKNFDLFEKTFAYNSFGTIEAREQLVQITRSVVSIEGLDAETKDKFFEFAVLEHQEQVKEAPNDARHWLLLGSIMLVGGRSEDAISAFERARELTPNKQMVGFQIGSIYINRGEYDKALKILKSTYEILPENEEAKIMYALAALYKGDDALAEEIMGDTPFADTRFVNLYVSRGQYGKVLEVWQALIEKEPQNASNWLSLGATYLQLGDRAKAIESIERAIEVNPDIKEQAEYYINEIRAGRNP